MTQHRNMVLIVDDMGSNRAFLRQILEDTYDLIEAENGEQALNLIRQNQEQLAAVLLDIVMPIKDGYQVLQEMSEDNLTERIPVIVITSANAHQNESRILKLGAADILPKPYDPYVLQRRLKNLVSLNRHKWHLEELLHEQTRRIHQSNEAIVNALSSITEFRSAESGQHILRIRTFTKTLLEDVAQTYPEYGFDEKTIYTISSASALHDIGKISIPDAVLNKPGRLTDEEFNIMKSHPVAGCQILESITGVVDRDYMRYAYNICRHHHERWDGRGYPDKLAGDEIPLCAQVVALADVYDALTTKRVYKDAFSHKKSANMILNGECGLFNPKLLECFKHVQDQFAHIAQSYADGHVPSADDIRAPLPKPEVVTSVSSLDTQHQSLIKYHTLLQYIGGTIIEVDLDHGIYHQVYSSDPTFSMLFSGESFREAFTNLATQAVHPDDWGVVMEQYSLFTHGFFEQELRQSARWYRIFHTDTKTYHWYQCTILRIRMDNPNLRRAIIIWAPAEHMDVANTQPQKNSESLRNQEILQELLGHVLRCRNDKWFTMMDGIEDLSKLIGYSRKEIHDQFNDRLIDLVNPSDQELFQIQVQEQLSHSSSLQTEFRMRHKDGRTIWVASKSRLSLGEDGTEYIYCVLSDNTRTRNSELKLSKMMERHKIFLQQTDDVVFEWDLVHSSMEISNNCKKLFGFQPSSREATPDLSNWWHNFHPDDLPVVKREIQRMYDGQTSLEAEARILCSDGSYLWCRLRGAAQQEENGQLTRLVGIITNINLTKCILLEQLEAETDDGLSELLSHVNSRTQISESLNHYQVKEHAAILLFHLGGLAQVTHRFGYTIGDSIVKKSTTLFHRLFRKQDVVQYLGQGEFIFLLRNIPDVSMVERRCEKLLVELDAELIKSFPECSIRLSIGVSLAPEHGTLFPKLFQCVDHALEQAKLTEHNSFQIYTPI